MDWLLREHLEAVSRMCSIAPREGFVPLRAGYVAYVHRVIDADGREYFFKTYDDARPISQMILPTLVSLTAASVWVGAQPTLKGRIVAPMPQFGPMRHGAYTTVVFPYIDGVTPRESPLTDRQLTNLVTSVAELHRLTVTDSALASVPREDFDALWTEAVLPALARIDSPGHQLHDVFAGRGRRLTTQFRRFRALAAKLAAQEHSMVVCHTDIHGYNVVIQDDIPLLIDWEGMKIAPKEHDLLFWVGDERWELIWHTYRQINHDMHIDMELLQFYRTRRSFEDLIQDIQRVEQEQLVEQEFVDLCAQIDTACTQLTIPDDKIGRADF